MPIGPVTTYRDASALLDPSDPSALTVGSNRLNNLGTVYRLSEEQKLEVFANDFVQNPDRLGNKTLEQLAESDPLVAKAVNSFADSHKLAKTDDDGNPLTVRQILEKAPEGIGLNTLRGVFDRLSDWEKALVLATTIGYALNQGGLESVLKLANVSVPVKLPNGNATFGVSGGVPTATVTQNLNPAATSFVSATARQPINGRFNADLTASFDLGGVILSGTYTTAGNWTVNLKHDSPGVSLGGQVAGGSDGLQIGGEAALKSVFTDGLDLAGQVSVNTAGQTTGQLQIIYEH